MNRYEQGWRESRDERFERKLRRLALVTVLCAVALVATGVTRGVTRGLTQRAIHEAGQLPTVAIATPNR